MDEHRSVGCIVYLCKYLHCMYIVYALPSQNKDIIIIIIIIVFSVPRISASKLV